MARPFNRRQTRENAAFVRLLADTGNAQLAARECGLAPGTLKSRRRIDAAFAAEWDAALTIAQARLAADPAGSANALWAKRAGRGGGAPKLTQAGGEPGVSRLKDGRLQLRRARRGGVGYRAEQAFLRALATCGNIGMAAQAVGVAPKTISARKASNPVFKAEMDRAAAVASDRLEHALMERFAQSQAGAGADGAWEDRPLPPLPPMTNDQAMMLLHLHRRREALGDEWGRLATRRRRGPLSSEEIAVERRFRFAAEQAEREAAERRRERGAARADHYERTGNWFLPGEEVADVPLGPTRIAKRRKE